MSEVPTNTPEIAVSAAGLTKSFGETKAVVGVDFEVPRGTVTALLGPNGAGKTTTVRMLATLLTIDDGSATVGGADVAKDPNGVRGKIGLTGQDTAVDELLTGRENLVLIGRLARLPKDVANARADELLNRFDLAGAADRKSQTYSGGMRRRLDLAASMVAEPEVLFLDEPTAALDPAATARIELLLQLIAKDGVKLVMVTHDLGQARRFADEVVFLHRGRLVEHRPAAAFFSTPRSCEARAFVAGELIW